MSDVNAADELSMNPILTLNFTTNIYLQAIPVSDIILQIPILLLTASNDPIGLASSSIQSTQPYALNFRTLSVDSGHFIQLEQSLKTNEYLEDFFAQVRRNKTGY
jgi:pimeloyl-ACP methyl ester carboxylesterase